MNCKTQREGDPVTNSTLPNLDRSALLGILAQQSDDVLQDLMRTIAQSAIDAQFQEFIGAEHYERNAGERKDYRNGSRTRSVDTRMGSIDLRVPRAREGNFVPPLVEHRKRSERALVAAVQEMFISGVSTRKIEKVLHELGVAQMSKSQVSVLCAELDAQVQAFRERRLTLAYPYVMLDALYVSIREDGRVGKQAVVIAYGVNEHGTREVIGIDVVQTESRESWLGFLRALVARGLHGVLLVVKRCARRAARRHYGRLRGHSALAALSRALLAECDGPCFPASQTRDRRSFPLDSQSVDRRRSTSAGRCGHRATWKIVRESHGNPRSRPGRCVSVLRLSHRASPQDLVVESDRASQRHATQTNERRRGIPEPQVRNPVNLDGAHRTN